MIGTNLKLDPRPEGANGPKQNLKQNNFSMKKHYLLLTLLALTITTSVQAQNDSIYVLKSSSVLEKHAKKPADLDTITLNPRAANLPQVSISNQVWATKNLEVTTYSDGTPIPQVSHPMAWEHLTTGAWCYYNNDPANGTVYGKLYNWYAAAGIYDDASFADPALRKNLAPAGWRVPTDVDWTTLTTYLGGEKVAGGKMKEKGTKHWQTPNTASSEDSGLIAHPGGFRNMNGTFQNIGMGCYLWSSTEHSTIYAAYRYLYYENSAAYRFSNYKTSGFSVRCIKD
ncbi:MAG: hypothetical protein CFE24_13660 [Flavobacterium sp. BFFFF2]|nr:MAG: hypothetical protein CFE24_13660 [Flavobacterium sp. BFFFF2]